MSNFCSAYGEDIKTNKTSSCKVLLKFHGITEFSKIEQKICDFSFIAYRSGNEIRVIIDVNLPNSLIFDLKSAAKSSVNFLLGYINEVLPRINQEILNRKYITAQILNKSLSVGDIQTISLANLKNNDKFFIPWPIGFSDFPFKDVNPLKFDYTYIRDLLDAMTSYLYFDYNESVRKIITSLDNAFLHYKVSKHVKKYLLTKESGLINKFKKFFFGKEKLTFNNIINTIIPRPELNFNIKIIYKIRNKIVHDKLRLDYKNDRLCHKGIGTLLYIYKGFLCDGQELADYILQIEHHYHMLERFYRGMKLENFVIDESKMDNTPIFSGPCKELDDFLFVCLKIREEELKGLI